MGETFGKNFLAHIGNSPDEPTKGEVTTTFYGSGTAILDVGHCGDTRAFVRAYLNDKLLASVPQNYKNFKIKFYFEPNDKLTIKIDHHSNYMIINSFEVSCKGNSIFLIC